MRINRTECPYLSLYCSTIYTVLQTPTTVLCVSLYYYFFLKCPTNPYTPLRYTILNIICSSTYKQTWSDIWLMLKQFFSWLRIPQDFLSINVLELQCYHAMLSQGQEQVEQNMACNYRWVLSCNVFLDSIWHSQIIFKIVIHSHDWLMNNLTTSLNR